MFCDPKEHGSQFKQIVKAVNLVLKSPDPLLPTQLRKFRHLYLNNKSKRAKVTRKNRVNNDSGTPLLHIIIPLTRTMTKRSLTLWRHRGWGKFQRKIISWNIKGLGNPTKNSSPKRCSGSTKPMWSCYRRLSNSLLTGKFFSLFGAVIIRSRSSLLLLVLREVCWSLGKSPFSILSQSKMGSTLSQLIF